MSDPAETGESAAAPQPVQLQLQVGATRPWWVPSTRIFVAIALFGLAWRALELLAKTPDLSRNTLFVTIATGLFGGGGILAVIGFYYIASKRDQQPGQGGAQ